MERFKYTQTFLLLNKTIEDNMTTTRYGPARYAPATCYSLEDRIDRIGSLLKAAENQINGDYHRLDLGLQDLRIALYRAQEAQPRNAIISSFAGRFTEIYAGFIERYLNEAERKIGGRESDRVMHDVLSADYLYQEATHKGFDVSNHKERLLKLQSKLTQMGLTAHSIYDDVPVKSSSPRKEPNPSPGRMRVVGQYMPESASGRFYRPPRNQDLDSNPFFRPFFMGKR